ncbi:cadherin-related family member 2 isoform X2 [Sceloporus undulatus]|uniref:cadherin-related family member 2 isoform X2 n=1 Tax=Sceloporus undulatus TaxID=8520 RepID=UPI001C4C64C6|nr:cadherin-related family member 2 isoform X2 [Sceloporus undulatus]
MIPYETRCFGLSRMLWLTGTLLCIFLAEASGNTAPRFDMNSSFTLPEDMPLRAWVFKLVAVDADHDELYYTIEGDNAYYFAVDHRTGNVTLNRKLDYEETKTFLVDAGVTDNKNVMVYKKLTIIVTDRNDNKPIFQDEPYFTDVPENTPVGSPIFRVVAVDDDSANAGRVYYSIEEVNPNNVENHQLFSILYNGTVVLNGSLSYNNKSTFYRIKILATDGGGLLNGTFIYQNNTAYLSVTVVDVADLDPQFLGEPYIGSVPEDCSPGTSVIKVFAIDRDKDVNDIIYYSITNTTSLFTIDNITGVLTVNGNLDREGVPGEEVQLQVVAREKDLNIYHQVAQVSTIVTIRVTDINDNTPQFYWCTAYPTCNFTGPPETNFTGDIEEHASSRTPVANLNIVAYDPDKGSNGTFQLSLQGPDALAFSVSPQQIVNEGAVQVLVSSPGLVDYEETPTMTVEIVANDTGNTNDCCSFAMVTIHLADINDHRPEFKQNDYKLSVLEESPPGTVVSSDITATDPDTGLYGEITYQLLPASILSTFTVNAASGTILVANGSKLDWGLRPVYYATLQATDGGDLSGSTQLEISVIDINNNAPIVTGSYNVFVNEGQDNITVEIQATDKDDPATNNSRLRFEILPGEFSSNFTINPDTGVLSSKGSLDREAIPLELQGEMVVMILVHDLGIPQLNTTVKVTFLVEDRNDNAPRFNSSYYEFSVRERLSGIFVGSVEATDADQTEINNRISFLIVESSVGSNNFLMHSICQKSGWCQGNLHLAPGVEFDYDLMNPKFFSLTVQAENSDFGGKVDVDTAVVMVNVLDVNDESPALMPSPPKSIEVLENVTLHEVIAVLEATDVDTNHSLLFQELAVTCSKDSASAGNICQKWFHLDPNGSLLVSSKEIDYEVCDLVELALRVKDEFTEVGDPYSRNETLKIFIVDVNDNPPKFLHITDTFVVIPEIAPVDLQVAVVKAEDGDSGVNSEISFALSRTVFIQDSEVELIYENLFKVVTTAEKDLYIGSIQVASNLDSSLKGRYQVTVEAKDHGMPSLNSSESLDIFTVDQSYRVKLEFSSSLKEVQDNSNAIKIALSAATGTTVHIATIKQASSTFRSIRASGKTVMEAYFIYSNGTALGDRLVTALIENSSEALTQLLSLGLSLVGPADIIEPSKENMLFGVIAGLAGFVLLLLLITTLTIICMKKSHTRKLKALKALKVASMFSASPMQQGPAIPGTNQYNKEGANPVLGFTLDPTMDLVFEENSSSEVASLNSLDVNMVDAPESGPASPALKGKVGAQSQANGRAEPLKAALEHHNKAKPKPPECLKEASNHTTEV